MSVIDTRRQQMFPVLDAGQIETAKRFASGPARDFAPGEIVFDVGERQAPAWLVLKGAIEIAPARRPRPRGGDHHASAGQFTGEISQLSGRATLAAGRAGPDGCTALPFDAAACPRSDGRLGGGRRDHHARLHPAPRRTAGGQMAARLGAGRPARHRRPRAAAGLPRAATAIPTPCSTPPTTRKAARWSSASACSRTSCR